MEIEIESKINKLLEEFAKQRHEIELMIEDLIVLKEKISSIFPENLDKRFRFIFEEKLKVVNTFFSMILEMRKQIMKSLTEEISVRRKIDEKEDSEDFEKFLDIRNYIKKMTDLTSEKNKIIENFNLPELENLPDVFKKEEDLDVEKKETIN